MIGKKRKHQVLCASPSIEFVEEVGRLVAGIIECELIQHDELLQLENADMSMVCALGSSGDKPQHDTDIDFLQHHIILDKKPLPPGEPCSSTSVDLNSTPNIDDYIPVTLLESPIPLTPDCQVDVSSLASTPEENLNMLADIATS